MEDAEILLMASLEGRSLRGSRRFPAVLENKLSFLCTHTRKEHGQAGRRELKEEKLEGPGKPGRELWPWEG